MNLTFTESLSFSFYIEQQFKVHKTTSSVGKQNKTPLNTQIKVRPPMSLSPAAHKHRNVYK